MTTKVQTVTIIQKCIEYSPIFIRLILEYIHVHMHACILHVQLQYTSATETAPIIIITKS